MMREALHRRLQHDEWPYPDLIVLDGGRPQLAMLNKYFKENNISIPLISIAKRPDRIITPQTNYKPIAMGNSQLLFKLFQSMRDESHRFAKKYHVAMRNRNLLN
ncbi:MAG: UvrABC system protein C [Microgenomates bacterium OLB23]|nr:MAG: UvrABC system protein C [Microgenomates bacterium OLB23]